MDVRTASQEKDSKAPSHNRDRKEMIFYESPLAPFYVVVLLVRRWVKVGQISRASTAQK